MAFSFMLPLDGTTHRTLRRGWGGRADCQRISYRVLERRILDLIIEVAPSVVANEMRADVFVAGILGRFWLVFEAVKERLRDFLLEIDSRKLADHPGANVFWKGVVAYAD